MADKPLIQSPRVRRLIIALIMAGILALAVLAAAAFAGRDASVRMAITFGDSAPILAGDLQAAVPIAWIREDDPKLHTTRFDSPEGDYQLNIMQLDLDDAANMMMMLNIAVENLDILSSDKTLQAIDALEQFRHNTWTGMRIIGTTSSGNDRTIHHLAIMTENARRFWVIHLQQNQSSTTYESSALLKRICATVTDTGRRDATSADLQAAGLTWTPTGDRCVLRVDRNHVPGEAIDVIFLNSEEPQIARVVGSHAPPAGSADEVTLLADYFESRVGHSPTDNERMAMNLTAGPRVTLVRTDPKTPGLTWAQAFMAYGEGQAMAVQLLSSKAGDQPLRDMLEAIGAYLKPTWNETLIANGERAITTLATLTEENTQEANTYYEMLRGDQSAGFGFERITPDEAPFAWQGDAVLIFSQSVRGPAFIKWRADRSGNEFSFIQLQRMTEDAVPGGYHLQNEGGRLSLRLVSRKGGEITAWTVETSPQYLSPTMLSYWRLDEKTTWQGQPALVDYADGRKKPQPYILQRGGGDAPMILLRSLVAVDADVMRLDDDGSVAAHHYAPADRPIAPSFALVLRKVDGDELAKRYPQMRSQIEKWSEAADLTE